MKNLLLTLILAISVWGLESKDPYKNIELHQLKNGIDVVFLPSQSSKNVKITTSFKVGMIDEDEGIYEITHLLEHLLFRDSRLENNNTYMQLIEQKGGSANGYTSVSNTSYIGTVPKKEGEWLVNLFSQMLLDRKIDKDDLPKEKKTIRLELGEPDWLSSKIGFDLWNWFDRNFFKINSWGEDEFGIVYPDILFSKNDRVLSLEKIPYDEVLKHYEKFYYPANMSIFVSGNFDTQKYLELIKEKFEKFENRSSAIAKKLNPTFAKKRYKEVKSFGKKSLISYGIKFDDVDAKEDVVLIAYNSYLAHRLMKKLRNEKAETYTVSPFYGNYNDYNSHKKDGYVGIKFETAKKHFFKNYNFVKDMIDNETQNGKITDEIISESIKYYMQTFELTSLDARNLMNLAIGYYKRYKLFGEEVNYYQILKSLNPKEFREILQKRYSTGFNYEEYNRPHIYSQIENYFVIIISAIFGIWFFYKIFNREKDLIKIRYIKSLSYSPLAILELFFILSFVVLIFAFLDTHLKYLLESSLWFNDVDYYPYYKYFFNALNLFLFIGAGYLSLSYFIKTIYIEDNSLVLDSFSSYHTKIDFQKIKTIKTLNDFQMARVPKLWFNKKFRLSIYDPFFWRERLLITLKNGEVYYLATKNAKEVEMELKKFIFQGDENFEV